jgi:hypothetical protein
MGGEPEQRQAADVLKHQRTRLDGTAEFDGPGEEVALVRGTKLVASDSEDA